MKHEKNNNMTKEYTTPLIRLNKGGFGSMLFAYSSLPYNPLEKGLSSGIPP